MIFNPTTRTRRTIAAVMAAGLFGTAGIAMAAGAQASPRVATAGAHASAVAAPRSTVPPSVSRAETAAEDVIGYLEKGQPAKSKAEARVLRTLARGSAADALRRAGVGSAAVHRFQVRADRVASLSHSGASRLRISQAANDVSALMPAFYSRFSDPVPAAVLALDHLDRQAQLDVTAGNRVALRKTVSELERTWRALRPSVVHQHDGPVVAARYDGHIAALKHGGSTRTIQREAMHGLTVVDQLESVFLGK